MQKGGGVHMISLCMCTFNGEKYLRNQLDSILNGTVLPNEIIIFDDCSQDGTLLILDDYKMNYPNLSWKIIKRNANVGWKVNFHDAINYAAGDIIFLADQDDVWKKDKIEKMSHAMMENPTILLLSCKYIYKSDGQKSPRNMEDESLSIRFVENDERLGIIGYHPGCTYALKKDIVNYFNDIWEKEFAHDRALWTVALLHGGLAIIDYSGIYWCRHSDSQTNFEKKTISERYENRRITCIINKKFAKYMNNYYQSHNIDNKFIKRYYCFCERREDFYLHPTIVKYINLFSFLKYYRSFKSYIADLLVFRKKEG